MLYQDKLINVTGIVRCLLCSWEMSEVRGAVMGLVNERDLLKMRERPIHAVWQFFSN